MSTEKKIVQDFLSFISVGDTEGMINLLDEDATIITPGSPKVPFNGRFEGKKSILQAFKIFEEFLEIKDHTLKLIISENEHVFVIINETSRAANTNRFIKQDTSWYFKIKSNKIFYWQVFEDTEQVSWAWNDSSSRK